MANRRIGILGGMFDPIHNGHLDVLDAAQAALKLGEIVVLPSSLPPHRPPPAASSYHRFAMVALAIAGRRRWRALDIELREPTLSYTSETLEKFHAQGHNRLDLFFITGADAFLEIGTWKNYPALLDLAHFAVISRPGVPVGEVAARLPALASRMGGPDAVASADSTMIFLIDAPTANVSSSAIRHARAHGGSIGGMVPPGVQQHIEQHALYEDPTRVDEAGSRFIDQPAGRLHGRD
jgi:nicotinate-nucleotide adenylyltransferase